VFLVLSVQDAFLKAHLMDFGVYHESALLELEAPRPMGRSFPPWSTKH